MALFSVDTWIKSPSDRDIIARWTAGKGEPRTHALQLPQPPDPERFRFLVVGDTGDSETTIGSMSPQEAVAREMAAEYAGPSPPALLLHLGDVVYMTGEKRLYDRNFRRPYAPFLTPESTADSLTFRTPFLAVPGNHDYYDLRGWVLWLAKLPVVGPGLRAIVQQLFAFGMPEGGSDMGRTYMEAFVDFTADTTELPLTYTPGTFTKLPNRYYRFRCGSVDFFALDSNTLDAPPPWKATQEQVREEAAVRVERLEEQYRALDEELKKRQERLEEWRRDQREQSSRDPLRRVQIGEVARAAAVGLRALADTLLVDGKAAAPCAAPADEAEMLARRWEDAEGDLRDAGDGDIALRLIETLEEASDDACSLLRSVEGCLGAVGEGEYKSAVLAARNAVDHELERWATGVASLPHDLCDDIRDLSERALDVQRELALERRRTRFRPDDYDAAQIEWLRAGLEQSARENPYGWRVVYLHHPLYSSIDNHCEHSDVQDMRGNLAEVVRGKAHLVLGGHAHAFEWFRSSAVEGAGVFVTGGGGQVSLRRSVFDPRLAMRNADRIRSMRDAGAQEWCGAGRGPDGADGAGGNLYHYLQVEVTPERLLVRPVGVRRLTREEYRREDPMPVFYLADLAAPADQSTRTIQGVEILKDGTVRPLWSG